MWVFNNIKIDLIEIGWCGMDWIDVALDTEELNLQTGYYCQVHAPFDSQRAYNAHQMGGQVGPKAALDTVKEKCLAFKGKLNPMISHLSSP
jgi:hypothetical protein